MDNIFVVSGIVSVIFIVIKFLEMRFVDIEKKKPLKFLLRDSLLVYFSVLIGNFVIDQVNPTINELTLSTTQPSIFHGDPDF